MIQIVYALRLRWLANRLQQWWFERGHVRTPVPSFPTVTAAVRYLAPTFKFWSSDRERGARWSDWSSHPEVTQARILAVPGPVGDCDDFAAWYCAALVDAVDEVQRISVWTWSGGHTAVIYRIGGSVYLLDYDRIVPIYTYVQAAKAIAARYDFARYSWVVETPDLRFVASS